jgi:hypothetical protein
MYIAWQEKADISMAQNPGRLSRLIKKFPDMKRVEKPQL